MYDTEEFWDDLLAFVEDGQVLPVIGGELLSLVPRDGPAVPLYRAVAERLLARYGLAASTSEHPARAAPEDPAPPAPGQPIRLRLDYELNDAVSALAKTGRRIQDLYRPVNDILKEVLDNDSALDLSPLEALARIRPLDLFVTTRSDPSLARVLDAIRYGGRPETDQIEFAPNLPGHRVRDLPERRPPGYSAVFYLFGRASNSPLYAIHDEDVLEFVYTLQSNLASGRERLSAEITNRHLLLIGCNFADWLSRFFLRLYNRTRLSGDRIKREFLVDHVAATDGNLTVFLERFSQNTRVCPLTSRAFVEELSRRWQERHPEPPSAPAGPRLPRAEPPPPPGAREIFISYSGNDLEAAKQLSSDVQGVGGGVIWFDKSALRPGDDWKHEILSAIKRCSLFLPLISVNTEKRPEGFFRREWSEAAERARQIQGQKFIVPVVIDADYTGDPDRYRLLPDGFRAVQFAHAPRGQLRDPLRGELVEQLRVLRRARS